MPDCPVLCGGPSAERVTPQQRTARNKYGCDSPCESARYAILCPACNGSGCLNDGRDERHPHYCRNGTRYMRRCPSSFQSVPLAVGIKAWRFLREHKQLPVDGGVLDQAASFVQLCAVLDSEVARVEAEMREASRKKSESQARRAKSKGGR